MLELVFDGSDFSVRFRVYVFEIPILAVHSRRIKTGEVSRELSNLKYLLKYWKSFL